MKVVLAPDSFKGSLMAAEVCVALRAGVRRVVPDAEIVEVPMGDGGEGTTRALAVATGGQVVSVEATGPLPVDRPRVTGEVALIHHSLHGLTAVLEMACVSGLPLIPDGKRNPLHTTTYGTGELIRAALEAGARHLIVGVGGSATCDLGAGMAQALGIKFLRADGTPILEPMTGALLADVASVDRSGLHRAVEQSQIEVACDVDNPLLGPRGCAAVYGPQKGATPAMVATLEANLAHAVTVIEATLGRRVRDQAGAGAAGGLAAGMLAFLGARLRSGVELVIDTCELRAKVRGADLVLTGEGRIDGQTASGKTVSGVAQVAREAGVPVVAIVGAIGDGVDTVYPLGLTSVFSLVPGPIALEQALRDAGPLITDVAERVMRLFVARRG
ncbi:MAG TPA: glycerate kinase [Polyangia bacterium]|nr:glycerate kinase [Polyangia bacterium]